MDNIEIKPIIEAVLFSADRPMTADAIRKLFNRDDRPDIKDVKAAIKELQEEVADRSYDIKEIASGFRLQVKQDFAPWILKLWEEKPPKYSRATLETLAIIAYRQPVTRAEIEDIRGVAVSSTIIKALQDREWIKQVGHRDVPGKPGLYATTKQFLDYFNLKKLEELPTLAEIKDLDEITERLSEQLPSETEITAEEETDSQTIEAEQEDTLAQEQPETAHQETEVTDDEYTPEEAATQRELEVEEA